MGLVTATGGVGGLAGALVAGRLARAFGSARTLILVNLSSGLFSLLIPLTARGPRIACYVIGAAVVSGGIIVSNVIAASFRQEYCPPSMLGRATASMRLVAFGAVPSAPCSPGRSAPPWASGTPCGWTWPSTPPRAHSFSATASAPHETCHAPSVS